MTIDPDPLTMPEVLGLLAALDAGDDSALSPLAGMLEAAGDPRAAGLRRLDASLIERGSGRLILTPEYHVLESVSLGRAYYRLPRTWDQFVSGAVGWLRRSDAVLALAEALSS